jgi:phage-related protein
MFGSLFGGLSGLATGGFSSFIQGAAGDSLGAIAQKFGGGLNFRDIASANNLSPFDVIGGGLASQIGIPNEVSGLLGTIQGVVSGDDINPQTLLNLGLDIAPELLGQINGASSVIEVLGLLRGYGSGGQLDVNLVQWLLDRSVRRK